MTDKMMERSVIQFTFPPSSLKNSNMGLFSGSSGRTAYGPLPPAPHPIGVNGFYTQHTNELALRIRERKTAFSGDDFAVKDAANGQTIFQVNGKVMSLSGKKDVKDAQGVDLFTIRKKHMAIRKTYKGDDAKTGQEIFKVESSMFVMGTKLKITFKNTAGRGEDLTLTLRGDLVG